MILAGGSPQFLVTPERLVIFYQRVSVLVQRFNAVLLHDSLPVPDCMD